MAEGNLLGKDLQNIGRMSDHETQDEGDQRVSGSPIKICDLKLTCIIAEGKEESALSSVREHSADAAVILVYEANAVDEFRVLKELTEQWRCKPCPGHDGRADKILCFYNEEVVGESPKFTREEDDTDNNFLTLTFETHNIRIFIIQLARSRTNDVLPKDRQVANSEITEAYKKIRSAWNRLIECGPVIAIGDFKEKHRKVTKILKNGNYAFVANQMNKLSAQKTKCTYNAYASGHCLLVSVSGGKTCELSPTTQIFQYKVQQICTLKLMYIEAKGNDERAKKAFLDRNTDAAVILVHEPNAVYKFNEICGSKSQWGYKRCDAHTGTADNICFYNKSLVGSDPTFVADEDNFLIMTFKGINLMIVHIAATSANSDQQSDTATTVQENIKDRWNQLRQEGPVLAIGEFKGMLGDGISSQLEDGTFAFVDGQMQKLSAQNLNCTYNACASHHCQMSCFYGEKVDATIPTVLAVQYKWFERGVKVSKVQPTPGLKQNVDGQIPAAGNLASDVSGQVAGVPVALCDGSEHESGQKILLSGVKLLYVSADRKQRASVIIDLFQKNLDATVIAVVEAHKDDIKEVNDELGVDWVCESHCFEEKDYDKILCFYNKKLVGDNVSFDKNVDGKFVTMKVLGPDEKVALELVIVHLPNKSTRKSKPGTDVKTEAHEIVKSHWKNIASQGPAIALGDFNLGRDQTKDDFLEESAAAFVNMQLPTNSKSYRRCTDNAYANSKFTLVSFYGETIDGLNHKVFAVGYKRKV